MFNNRFRKYFLYAQMTSFIFETIIEFSAAIKNVYAQLVLMNRGLTSTYTMYNANLNATVGPADLFVPLRNKSSSSFSYSVRFYLLKTGTTRMMLCILSFSMYCDRLQYLDLSANTN